MRGLLQNADAVTALSSAKSIGDFTADIGQSWRRLQGQVLRTIRDLAFDFIIDIPKRDTVKNAKIGASISTRLGINTPAKPFRKTLKHTNSPKIQHFASFSTHLDREGQAKHLIKLAIRRQTCIAGHLRSMKFKLQPAVEIEPQSVLACFIHWVLP
jgi:hypothetical protein